MNNVFIKPLNSFGERLEALMEQDGINVSKKGSDTILARKMIENGSLSFLVNEDMKKRTETARTRIGIHRKTESAENTEGKWLKAYCDYFKCSADYLLGYIDLPTHHETDIAKTIGLSPTAIRTLAGLKSLSNYFPGSQTDKFDVINLILSDIRKSGSLSSLLDMITGFCRFDVANNKSMYTVDKRGITPFQHSKIPSERGIAYNPLQAHFHLQDMESMYYLKIWDSIRELKEMYLEHRKAPDTN